jgi:hypothetical protein
MTGDTLTADLEQRASTAITATAWAIGLLLGSPGLAVEIQTPATSVVDVAEKPGLPFSAKQTFALTNLPPIALDPEPDRFGGQGASNVPATGFFQVVHRDGRWWLIDPDGGTFLCRGMNSVTPLTSKAAQTALQKKFGSEAGWAEATTHLLRSAGFNAVGAWSDEGLRRVAEPLPYTRIWNFMAAYGKRRGGTFSAPGHTGYPGDCPFIFDSDFTSFCDEHARQLAATKDDPWLIGHFSDNELPWKRSLLESALKLPPTDPGHQAARAWLTQVHGEAFETAALTDEDRAGFLEHAIDRYLAVVSQAIRRHDPNHLFLGMRLHGAALRLPEVWRACGRHCDIVSVNYYHAWTPSPDRMAMWGREAGRPFLVTEFYAKGADSGLGNVSGAGWLVKTQADRGRFYQNFTLGLLASADCVGWQWHRYADNDPAAEKADASNLDSNKGVVSSRYVPWQPLVMAMEEINRRAHGLETSLRNPEQD